MASRGHFSNFPARRFSPQRPANHKQAFMFCLLSTVYSVPPSVLLYRSICAFSAQKPTDFRRLLLNGCIFVKKPGFIGIHFVIIYLFSCTSPEVPSFLTSLGAHPTFRTLEK